MEFGVKVFKKFTLKHSCKTARNAISERRIEYNRICKIQAENDHSVLPYGVQIYWKAKRSVEKSSKTVSTTNQIKNIIKNGMVKTRKNINVIP